MSQPGQAPQSPAGSELRDAIHSAAVSERRAALRRLLARPLAGQREDPEGYASIVRHRHELAAWLGEHTGWQLVVDASVGFARLHKSPSHPDATRPALTVGRDRRAFDRRRYTLLCLALAALDQRPGQTTLKHLVGAVTGYSHEQDGIDSFDATRYAERRALVDALKLLAALGILMQRDGDADRYAMSGAGDALYDVDDRRLGQLIAAPSSPSLVSDPAELPVEVYPDTEEGARLRARHRVMRRLLDDPVCYYDDLDEPERDWLIHSLRYVHDVLDRDVGLTLERRSEGVLGIDSERELTDDTFPDGSSTVKHAALLLAEQLTNWARSARGGGGPMVVADQEVTTMVRQLIEAVGRPCGWSSSYLDAEHGPRALAADALDLLHRFGLVSRRRDGWEPRPALARFAPAPPGRGPGERELTTRSGAASQPTSGQQVSLLEESR